MKIIDTIACLFILIAALSCSAAHHNNQTVQAAITTQPLFQADPTIFYSKGVYYLYGTNGATADSGFRVFTSKDTKRWKASAGNNGWALKKGDAFGTHGFWAPQVFGYHDKFYMAYTANEHIAIAQSDSPLGPFTQTNKQPIDTTIKTIDPFVLMEDGNIYLYHVRLQDGNRIFVCQMNDNLSAVLPNTLRPCISAAVAPQPWENTQNVQWTVTEGPTVIKHNNLYYLLYSANDFRNPDYAVGYATADNPLGPWKKYEGNPIIKRALFGINGTGHGDIVNEGSGTMYYVFHTHFSNTVVGPRRTAIVQLRFTDNSDTATLAVDTSGFRYLVEVK